MKVANKIFEEPVLLDEVTDNRAGIYLVFSYSQVTGSKYLYVGQTNDLSDRLSSHNERQSWLNNATGPLKVAFLPMTQSDEDDRLLLEGNIITVLRQQGYTLPCNEQ